jgi:pyruvate ferredoxin oxidoreductase delta subunit
MKLKGWKELEEGAIIKGVPTSPEFKTGDWRSKYPHYIPEKCTHDLLCWLYCPDSAITVKDGKIEDFLLDYCKGCGICAEICPQSAIEMKEEER